MYFKIINPVDLEHIITYLSFIIFIDHPVDKADAPESSCDSSVNLYNICCLNIKYCKPLWHSIFIISKFCFIIISKICPLRSLEIWHKVWFKLQGCVVKVFPRELTKDTQSVT